MKIMTHFRKFEMSRENIFGHIVRITRSESNAIKSFDTIDSLEKFPERSFFRISFIPLELLAIPEFFLGFFSVAVDVLSEKGYFLGSVSYTFLRFFQYLILRSRDFATSSIRNYAITTEIVTSGLYDDVGGSWIVLGLLHL